MNERITEEIVRAKFRPFLAKGFLLEEQKSKNPRIDKLLQSASKSGSGVGRPEFIISHEEDSDFLMVIECKADVKYHQSQTLDQYSKYAVDGALLYSSYLAKDFDVISLGVSGQSKRSLKATSYLQLKSQQTPKPFLDGLHTLPIYKEKYIHDEDTRHQRYEILLDYNKILNQQLHNHKIQEDKRSLLISGILIALEHDVFKSGFTKYKTSQQLANSLVNSIVDQLQLANIPEAKVDTLKQAYNFIRTNRTLRTDKEFFINLIKEVDEKINSFVKTYKFYDIFGEFYVEFLRYANSDKGLGIVLTPKHITELFCDIAGVTKDSVIFDNCCGTGGFLISAMRKMIAEAKHNKKKEKHIKGKQIVGIEYQDSIFPLACSNMIIHGDGQTNISNDDCFKTDVVAIRKKFHPNVGLLNPPFKTDKEDTEELEFVLNNLEGLVQNALCVAVLPMQCALSQKGTRLALKEKIMEQHTLEAVMSLPGEIFYNSKVSTVTCAMVIRAHKPHPIGYKTYFGYWKDDGFVKRKNKGRVDGGRWNKIQAEWLTSFRNRDSVVGISVLQVVASKDEWCAEAYMETNYSKLTENDFIKTIQDYIAFQFLHEKDS